MSKSATLGHNLRAERAILGGLLIVPEHIAHYADKLDAEDFYEPAHQEYWRALVHAYQANKPGDLVEIREFCAQRGTLDLLDRAPDNVLLGAYDGVGRIGQYAKIVFDFSMRRQQAGILMQMAQELLSRAEGEKRLAALDVRRARFTGDDGVDDATLSASRIANWPDPMADAAYIGPIGRFVQKLAPHTEASPESLLIQALVAAGNAMGRHGYFVAEANHHYTNLYAVIVAGTGARKGTSWGHVRRFMDRAAAEWVAEHIVGGLSSGEGLIHAVRDEDPTIPDKVALALETEFGAVFKVKGRDGNTLGTVMRQAWDGDELRTLTKNSPLRATGTHISLIGHITAEELRRLMHENDASNGFANRILWVCAKRARFLPNGGNLSEGALNAEVAALHAAIEYGKTVVGELKRDREARALWCERYRDLSTGRPGLLGAVTGRAEAQVTRLSLIYALLDRSPIIKKVHLEAALAVWDYCLASARFIFGEALGDALAEKLHELLHAAGARGMTRTDMFHQLGNNPSRDALARALGMLEAQGMAEKRYEVGDGGRRVYRWYAITYEFNEDNEFSDASAEEEPPLHSLNSLTSYPVRRDREATDEGEEEYENSEFNENSAETGRNGRSLNSLNSLNSYPRDASGTNGNTGHRVTAISLADRVAQLNAQGIHGDAAIRRALAERGELPGDGGDAA